MINFYSGSAFLIVFTIAFILMDEYVAKPLRRRRLEKRAEREPKVREALRVTDRIAARDQGRGE